MKTTKEFSTISDEYRSAFWNTIAQTKDDNDKVCAKCGEKIQIEIWLDTAKCENCNAVNKRQDNFLVISENDEFYFINAIHNNTMENL